MKRLLVVLLLTLSVGLAAHRDAKADYFVSYPDTSEAIVQALGGGYLAFIFFDFYGDIFTTQSSPSATPYLASLEGAPFAFAYYLTFAYYSGPYTCFDAYRNSGSGWFIVGVYCL